MKGRSLLVALKSFARCALYGMSMLVLMPAQAHAQEADPRIQIYSYDPNVVYPLSVFPSFAAVVEFARDEAVESVIVGDSDSWQITQMTSANRLVVKPVAGAAQTNMVVVTNQRRYAFFLSAAGTAQDAYILQFNYADAAAPARPAASYKLRGKRAIWPTRIEDDGRDTYIVWDEKTPIPAVFGLDESGKEMLLNGRMTGRGFRVEGVHSQLFFRMGGASAAATRKTLGDRK